MSKTKEEKKDEKLSPHFKLSELVVTDEQDLKQLNFEEGFKIKDKLVRLAEFAESVRAVLGCPMIITSGFRCEALNAKIGGAIMSQHRFAEAIDFIPKKMSAFEAFSRIMISGITYGQLILEKRGQGHVLHIGMGFKRQKMYSPSLGKNENIL